MKTDARLAEPSPSSTQIRIVRAAVDWYLRVHHGGGEPPGTAAMFCDRERVGGFAVRPQDLAQGDSASLFRVLVATAMFQRRQDQQVLRILRGMASSMVEEITDAERLQALASASPCAHLKTVESLRDRCDLTKDPATGRGTCSERHKQPCHLKLHTVALKRYGHFGKMPTSVALSLLENGAGDLSALFTQVIATHRTRLDRAIALEAALCAGWRVNQKIASMFLSAVTNPDLSPGCTVPWSRSLDWTYFVVVDSNVDLFLSAISYSGPRSYNARRDFVRALAARVDLRRLDRRLRSFNPRLVQQAMYLFMSVTNRRASPIDCSHFGAAACGLCPRTLANRCALRTSRK